MAACNSQFVCWPRKVFISLVQASVTERLADISQCYVVTLVDSFEIIFLKWVRDRIKTEGL